MTAKRYAGVLPLSAHPNAVLIEDPAAMTADQIARCRSALNIASFARSLARAAVVPDNTPELSGTGELSAADEAARFADASPSPVALSAPVEALNSPT